MARSLPWSWYSDPDVLRREVDERFTPQRMVRDHLAAYEAAIAEVRENA